jgi:hypothetical protein
LKRLLLLILCTACGAPAAGPEVVESNPSSSQPTLPDAGPPPSSTTVDAGLAVDAGPTDPPDAGDPPPPDAGFVPWTVQAAVSGDFGGTATIQGYSEGQAALSLPWFTCGPLPLIRQGAIPPLPNSPDDFVLLPHDAPTCGNTTVLLAYFDLDGGVLNGGAGGVVGQTEWSVTFQGQEE